MGPSDQKVRGLAVIRKTPLTLNEVLKPQTEVSRKPVAHIIARFCSDPPAPIGVNVSENGKVYVVVDRKVISSILQEITLVVVLPPCWNDKARGRTLGDGRIEKGQEQGRWNVCDDQVAHASHDLAVGHHLDV